MICYQDEKMYGPPVEGMTEEQLQAEIEQLEMEIYGRTIPENIGETFQCTQMIYDIELGELVERK